MDSIYGIQNKRLEGLGDSARSRGMQLKPIQAVLFDLDGTLVDNFEAIYAAYSYMQRTFGRKVVDFETFKCAVGGGIQATMQTLLGKEDVEEDVRVYREYYARHGLENVQILPGVEWVLEQLHAQGCILGVLTNKWGDAARKLCDHVGLIRYFSVIVGVGDTPYVKPDRTMTDYALKILGVEPEVTAMVGDSPFDIQTALNANLRPLVVATGSHDAGTLLKDIDVVYKDMWELGHKGLGLKACPVYSYGG